MAYTIPVRYDFTVTATGALPWIALNTRPDAYPCTISVKVTLGSGASITYSVEQALDNPNFESSPDVIVHPRLISETTSKASTIDNPYSAVRVNVSAFTLGSTPTTVRVHLVQSVD